jgi:hypothetical protein
LKKYYNVPEKATVYAGNSSITVYGDTAKLVNTLASLAAIVAFLALLSKLLK